MNRIFIFRSTIRLSLRRCVVVTPASETQQKCWFAAGVANYYLWEKEFAILLESVKSVGRWVRKQETIFL